MHQCQKHMVYTSFQTTQNLGTYETRKYRENLKTSWKYSLVPSLSPKIKILTKS